MKLRFAAQRSCGFVGALALALILTGGMKRAASWEGEKVRAIAASAQPLPPEEKSAKVTKFSFILYGDARGGQDGIALQSDHSRVIDGILSEITTLQPTKFPARFILQTGDAVVRGEDAHEWNVSFIPLIDRLIQQGRIPYFFVPGNHDVSSASLIEAPPRPTRFRNVLDAFREQMPPEGSPRRLAGYPTYSFGYGNTFVIGFDSVNAGDDNQYLWVKGQLEGLDRNRYANIFVFCHHAPFSSGPHSLSPDNSIVVLRTRYLPLFHAHHVRAVLAGHEHLYEHWVEHYTDHAGRQRMDCIVSGGGGAPLYLYMREPDLSEYLNANRGLKVQLQHLVKPGPYGAPSPHHFIVIRVDGNRVGLEFHAVDNGSNFRPYPDNQTALEDASH